MMAFVALMLTTNPATASSFAASASAGTVAIEVPSDPAIVGVNTVQYLHPEGAASWDALYRPGGYTDQTLANFSRDDSRGIFLVHTLEENLGNVGGGIPLQST